MATFGSDTTWLKGKLGGSDTYTYVNLYQCLAIAEENSNDYIIQSGGHRFKIFDCVAVGDLTDIEPPEEE